MKKQAMIIFSMLCLFTVFILNSTSLSSITKRTFTSTFPYDKGSNNIPKEVVTLQTSKLTLKPSQKNIQKSIKDDVKNVVKYVVKDDENDDVTDYVISKNSILHPLALEEKVNIDENFIGRKDKNLQKEEVKLQTSKLTLKPAPKNMKKSILEKIKDVKLQQTPKFHSNSIINVTAQNIIKKIEKILLDKFNKAPKTPIINTFKDTLLLINFNHPFYANIELLHDMYDKVFAKVIICGRRQSKKKDIDIVVEHYRGYLGYHCAVKAMQLYPNYEGYLYGSDDMIINWWQLTHLSKTKLWIGSNKVWLKQLLFKPIRFPAWPNGKGHWVSKWGVPACKQFYTFLLSLNGTRNNNLLENYNEGCEVEPCCFQTWSDLFFIPKRLKNQFILLSTTAFKHNMFLEIAVPTMLMTLDKREHFEILNGLSVTDYFLEKFANVYNFNTTFIHPFKCGIKDERGDISRNILKNYIVKYAEMVLR